MRVVVVVGREGGWGLVLADLGVLFLGMLLGRRFMDIQYNDLVLCGEGFMGHLKGLLHLWRRIT